MENRNFFKDVLLGVATGDALGVPVEFRPRQELKDGPVMDMRAFGTHNQPMGTWSDDSALTFCLAEMLCSGFDLDELAQRFIDWKEYAYWTANGTVFDIGIATSVAIYNLTKGVWPTVAGGSDEGSNGNGSLMRIAPLVFYVYDKDIGERFEIIKAVSSLTHRHIRSVIGCFIYIEMMIQILNGENKWNAFLKMQDVVNRFLKYNNVCSGQELNVFHRLLCNPISNYEIKPIHQFDEDEVYSSGYVLHTLEASIWCLLNTGNYREAVLAAVNLGNDSDSTAAVTGGIAGLLYGSENIPGD